MSQSDTEKQNQQRAKGNKKENSNNVKKKKEKHISKKTIRRFILTENSKAEELDKLCENKQVKYTINLHKNLGILLIESLQIHWKSG